MCCQYYISPTSLVFLFVPWLVLEYPKLLAAHPDERAHWLGFSGSLVFVSNALCAFALNCAVFLLIGKSSALTMNLAGVVKDW